MSKKLFCLYTSIITFSLSGVSSSLYAETAINSAKVDSISAQSVKADNVFNVNKGSTLIFNIKQLSDHFGYSLIVKGDTDIEILKDSKITLSNYQDNLSDLIKGYPVHVDLYEANHVAVISILNSKIKI